MISRRSKTVFLSKEVVASALGAIRLLVFNKGTS